jgi:hypothetical protein
MGTTASRSALSSDLSLYYLAFIDLPFTYTPNTDSKKWYHVDYQFIIHIVSLLFGIILIGLASTLIDRYQSLTQEQGGVYLKGLTVYAILAGIFMVLLPGMLTFTIHFIEGTKVGEIFTVLQLMSVIFNFIVGILVLSVLPQYPLLNNDPVLNSLGAFLIISSLTNVTMLPFIYDYLIMVGRKRLSPSELKRYYEDFKKPFSEQRLSLPREVEEALGLPPSRRRSSTPPRKRSSPSRKKPLGKVRVSDVKRRTPNKKKRRSSPAPIRPSAPKRRSSLYEYEPEFPQPVRQQPRKPAPFQQPPPTPLPRRRSSPIPMPIIEDEEEEEIETFLPPPSPKRQSPKRQSPKRQSPKRTSVPKKKSSGLITSGSLRRMREAIKNRPARQRSIPEQPRQLSLREQMEEAIRARATRQRSGVVGEEGSEGSVGSRDEEDEDWDFD